MSARAPAPSPSAGRAGSAPRRAGIARTGGSFSNGSGDYAVAFSTAAAVRRDAQAGTPATVADLPNGAMSPAFQAVAEATEEAVLNALFSARTLAGHGATVPALPLDRIRALLRDRTPNPALTVP